MAKYSNKKLMSMVSSSNVFDRVTAAKNGCGLETLVGDPSWRVRSAVASVGYGLDVLKDDMKYQVRVAVAQQGCYLDEFSKDEHWEVRLQAFKQGVSVNYIDDKTGEYLRSFLEAPLFYLIHSAGLHVNSRAWHIPKEIDSVGECLQFAKNSDFSTLKKFGEASFQKMISALSYYGVDCSDFRFRGKTFEDMSAKNFSPLHLQLASAEEQSKKTGSGSTEDNEDRDYGEKFPSVDDLISRATAISEQTRGLADDLSKFQDGYVLGLAESEFEMG